MASRFGTSLRSLLVVLAVLGVGSVAVARETAPVAPSIAETEGAPTPTPDPTKPIPW